ncbi:MAG TPA: CBS domain-containing protein [Actinomycetes bacterium]|nr:CBS domain-containing protein [Actinomycetes bacterium]
MLAREIAEDYPVVHADADVYEAAHAMAVRRLPGIIVVDGDPHRPIAVLPGTQVVRLLIPHYVQDDPTLARVFTEDDAAELFERLRGRTVRSLLPDGARELPVVRGDDQVLEIAALMARLHSPLIVVSEHDEILGAVTTSRLLEILLPDV